MNTYTLSLIDALAKNDIERAKTYAKILLKSDKTDKNRKFCESRLSMLEKTDEDIYEELPYNIKSMLIYENVQERFDVDRYYLAKEEQELFKSIKRACKVSSRMKEDKVNFLNSTLLWGVSGTGKTTFAKYVAYMLQKPFFYLKFSMLIDSLMGNTSKNIHLVMDFIRKTDCVFMMDEIDTISLKRSSASGGSDNEMSRITVTIMQEMDDLFYGDNNVILIGATNRKDRMDEALLRRFSIDHEVKILGKEERLLMAGKFFQSLNRPLPLEVSTFCEEEHSQAEINVFMVETLAKIYEQELGEEQNANAIHMI